MRSVWFEPGTSAYFASIATCARATGPSSWAACAAGARPGENQVYADGNGHIGWKPCGFAPIRRNWDGLMPVPGDGRYEWDGFLDPDLPAGGADPKRGWIATANAENLPRGYPYRRAQARLRVGGAVPAAPHPVGAAAGARRVARRLAPAAGRPPLAAGRAAGPAAAGLKPRSRRTARAIRLLRRWDRVLSRGLRRRRAVRVLESLALPTAVLRAALGSTEGGRRDLAGRPDAGDPGAGRAHPPFFFWARPRFVLLAQPGAGDRPHGGAARQALGALEWGELHVAHFDHPTAAVLDEGSPAG